METVPMRTGKHARLRLIGRRTVAALAAAFVVSARAVFAQATGGIEGTVRSAQADIALSYAVVSIPSLSIERFTDSQGKFTLAALPTGSHQLVVRRIGYSPFRSMVQVDSGSTSSLAITLQQIPVRLATTTVRALADCPRPGVPDEKTAPEIFSLVGLLRENADRYRLLASQYPFIYLQIRAIGEMGPRDMFLSRVDTLLVKSGNRTVYAPGKVVSRSPGGRDGSEYTMVIPTLVDLADDAFTRNHCFTYGGTDVVDGETWVRIDVRAADRISSPDVHGSFFLDSATAQLRRMILTLSRPDRLPRALRGVVGVDMITSFVDIADGLSVIDRVCAINRITQPRGRLVPVTPAELQQLLVYEFTTPPPGMNRRKSMLPPVGWRTAARIDRKDVWCADP
jgi:hypothetical protein